MAPEDGVRGGTAPVGRDDLCLDPFDTLSHAAAKAPRALSWTRAGIADPASWQEKVRIKLTEISGYGRFGGPPQMLARRDLGQVDGLRHQSLYVRARHAFDVPVRIVYRDSVRPGAATVICLQGGGIGMRVSWADAHTDAERDAVAAGFDFACQAAERGHVAVCVELMGAGERNCGGAGDDPGDTLRGIATHGMLIGHSLLGQHASDISAVVNWLHGEEVDMPIDPARTAVIGHDLGAAAALVSAALDPRLAASALIDPPVRFRDAVKRRAVTPEMTMPGLLHWMDLDDILMLCAPRPVLACTAHKSAVSDARDLLEAAQLFYGLFDAGDALTVVDAPDELWERVDAMIMP